MHLRNARARVPATQWTAVPPCRVGASLMLCLCPLQYRKSFQRGHFHLGFLSIPIGIIAVTWVLFLTVSMGCSLCSGRCGCRC